MPARRLALILLVAFALGSPTAGSAAGSATSGSSPDRAVEAKRLPLCKKGKTSKRRCRAPRGYRVVKTRKGYRCVKIRRPAAKSPATAPPATPPATEPAPAAEPPPATNAAGGVRNDQAFTDALKSAVFYKTYNGGAGYGSYAYNFMPDVLGQDPAVGTLFRLRYCTYYVSFVASGSALRENYDGAWTVKEGYTHPDRPGTYSGLLVLWRQGMPTDQAVQAKVAFNATNAEIEVGDGSKYFEGGQYVNKPGRATRDCSTWEPESAG